jgi:PAS domain S-box-containing protein
MLERTQPAPAAADLAEIRERLARLPDPMALLEGLFAYAPVGFQIYRADGTCLLTNRAFRQLFGAEPPPGYNVLHDEIAAERGVLGLIHRAFAGETIETPPVWYDPRDLQQVKVEEGRPVAMSATFFPLRDAEGKVAFVAIAFKDLTEEMQARQRVQLANARATLVADALPQITWTSRPDGSVQSFNRRWYEYTGLSAETETETGTETDAWRAVVHPDDLSKVAELWEHARSSGEPYEAELRLLRGKDRSYRWHLARSVPVRDDKGEIAFWVGCSTDIEEQRRAAETARFLEEASTLLGSSLEDYEATLKSLAQLVVPRMADWCVVHLLDRDTKEPKQIAVAHADPQKKRWAQELSRRYPPDPNAPRGTVRVIKTGEPELYEDITDDLLVKAARDEEHLKLLRATGMRSAMIVPLRSRRTVLGALTFVWAESGRRYTQKDLGDAQELADRAAQAIDNARLYYESQQAIRVRDDFLSIASHELRTPLTPLQLHVQALQRSATKETGSISLERIVSKLETVARQVNRLTSLVDNLLDISRITTHRLHIEREPVDLVAVVADVVSRLGPELTRGGYRINIEAPPSMIGNWDRLRIDQIVSNLLGNAVKFGRGKPIDIGLRVELGSAVLRVVDQGIGIPAGDQARIFERFERAVAGHHYGGFGLGLWIVRQIVEALGGTIGVESRLGEGSTFTVKLPLAELKNQGTTEQPVMFLS